MIAKHLSPHSRKEVVHVYITRFTTNLSQRHPARLTHLVHIMNLRLHLISNLKEVVLPYGESLMRNHLIVVQI